MTATLSKRNGLTRTPDGGTVTVFPEEIGVFDFELFAVKHVCRRRRMESDLAICGEPRS